MTKKRSDVSEIGYWSEVKLDIIREYAAAYSKILSAQQQPSLRHVYIDAFSGCGFHMAKDTHDLVWGSPAQVMLVDPPFSEYHFIDLDQGNIETLKSMVNSRNQGPYDPKSVYCYNADCNEVLISKIFPNVRYEDYARALCLLDPYGLHLDWEVIRTAGHMKSIELFLNFPIHDMNRNVLLRNPDQADPRQVARMTRYWGDDSWRDSGYSSSENLFGFDEKRNNDAVVRAFCDRLRSVAGFTFVADPMAMRNTKGSVIYYLLFASQKPVAKKIVREIFAEHCDRRS